MVLILTYGSCAFMYGSCAAKTITSHHDVATKTVPVYNSFVETQVVSRHVWGEMNTPRRKDPGPGQPRHPRLAGLRQTRANARHFCWDEHA